MQNSPALSAVEVGAVIDETYLIETVIGRGGMGAVYLASHTRLAGKKVAIKMLHAELGGDEVLARFKREADIASQLDHPNIVKVENYNKLADGTPYIVYEYLQGESLAQRLADGGAMAIDSVFSILRQIGSALSAAHRAGIVHRDLKPQNIFLVPSEIDGRAIEIAKVLDFGISKMRGSQTVKTQEATLLGTPQYMAPEQATGQHTNVDERTDIFALGAILYEMVSGQPAFTGANIPEVVFKVVYETPRPLAELVPNLADVLVNAIAKAMAKAPADRYANVNELVEAMTGSPLSLIRKPRASGGQAAAATPSQNLKDSSNDAFAKTMGSGDHGASPVRTGEAFAASGSAPTIDSQRTGAAAPVGPAGNAATVAQAAAPAQAAVPAQAAAPAATPIPATPATPAPRVEGRGKGGLIAGIAIAAIGLGAAAIFVATRPAADEPAREHRVRRAPVATTPPPPPVPPPSHVVAQITPPPVLAVDAGSEPAHAPPAGHESHTGSAAAASRPHHPAKADPADKPAATEDDAGDETMKQRLAAAEASLRAGDLAKVERLANSIITNEASGPNQIAHARVLHGICQCSLHNSEEQAKIDLRLLKGHALLRARLLRVCHAENHLTSD